jgi:hypothetical protein
VVLHFSRLRRCPDAPLIGARAATRGRTATEGGDEHGDVKKRYRFAFRLKGVDGLTTQRAKLMAPLTALDGVMPTFE